MSVHKFLASKGRSFEEVVKSDLAKSRGVNHALKAAGYSLSPKKKRTVATKGMTSITFDNRSPLQSATIKINR